MTWANLALNDSLKITWIKQKYDISLLYKMAIDFLSSIARSVTYSSFIDSFYIGDLFNNLGNMCVEFLAQ